MSQQLKAHRPPTYLGLAQTSAAGLGFAVESRQATRTFTPTEQPAPEAHCKVGRATFPRSHSLVIEAETRR